MDFSFLESLNLDFLMKYGLVISNFFLIAIILIAQKYRTQSANTAPKKNVLLVIAHPDDESMFFIPTLKSLITNYHVFLLCLSNGNADGLGSIRERELEHVVNFLKIREHVVLNNEEFLDGFDRKWDVDAISKEIQIYKEKWDINAIVSFDEFGISNHPNHIAVYHGLMAFKNSYEGSKVMKFYKLETVNIIRKFSGLLDFFTSSISDFCFVNYNPIIAWKAMKMHQSQFVWYRKLFIIFSRYAYVNTLKEIKI